MLTFSVINYGYNNKWIQIPHSKPMSIFNLRLGEEQETNLQMILKAASSFLFIFQSHLSSQGPWCCLVKVTCVDCRWYTHKRKKGVITSFPMGFTWYFLLFLCHSTLLLYLLYNLSFILFLIYKRKPTTMTTMIISYRAIRILKQTPFVRFFLFSMIRCLANSHDYVFFIWTSFGTISCMANTVQQIGKLPSQVLQECESWRPGRQCIVNYIALTWQAWETKVQAVSQGVPASIITSALPPPSTSPHPAFSPLPMGLFNLTPPSAAVLPLGGCSRDGLSQTDSRSSFLARVAFISENHKH